MATDPNPSGQIPGQMELPLDLPPAVTPPDRLAEQRTTNRATYQALLAQRVMPDPKGVLALRLETLVEQLLDPDQPGQTWAVLRVVRVDPDGWLRAADAADVAAVTVATLRKWRGRGRLVGRLVAGRWEYRAADVLTLAATARRGRAAARLQEAP